MNHLPPELQAQIKRKQEELQRQYQEVRRKQQEAKLNDICGATNVSREEAECALNLCENDELEAINRLAVEASFKLKVQEMACGTSEHFDGEENVAMDSLNAGGRRRQARPEDDDDEGSEDEDGFLSEGEDGTRRRKKRRSTKTVTVKPPKNKNHIEGFNTDGTPRAPTIRLGDALRRLDEIKKAQEQQQKSPSKAKSPRKSPRKSPTKAEEVEEDEVFEKKPASDKKKVTRTSPRKTAAAASPAKVKSPKKAEIDYTFEDLKQLEWSDARIKAFLGRKDNPNAYYYRFNDPGEEQRTGGWTKEEHERFMDLIKDGVDYHWGIFSKKTPGRVGYQCSNYYRKLIADGKVVDPNYSVDEKGKLTFTKGVKRFRPNASEENQGTAVQITDATVSTRQPKKKKSSSGRKRRSRGGEFSESELESGDTTPSEDSDDEEEGDGKKKKKKKEYLLGDMQDAMTLKSMQTPAISPFGHVLDYTTWLRLLKLTPQNTCPFTKQRVTRRDLIKLTKENVDEHRDKIVVVKYDLGDMPSSSSAFAASPKKQSGADEEVDEEAQMDQEE